MSVSGQKPQMLDAFGVSDIFISGLGEIEHLGGGCYRFTFYTKQHIGDREELVVTARLVVPMEAVPPAVQMTAKAVGFEVVKFIGLSVH